MAKGAQRCRVLRGDALGALVGGFVRAEPGADPVGDLVEGDAGTPPLPDHLPRCSSLDAQASRLERGQSEFVPEIRVIGLDPLAGPGDRVVVQPLLLHVALHEAGVDASGSKVLDGARQAAWSGGEERDARS